MRPRSSSRGHNTSASVIVTVYITNRKSHGLSIGTKIGDLK